MYVCVCKHIGTCIYKEGASGCLVSSLIALHIVYGGKHLLLESRACQFSQLCWTACSGDPISTFHRLGRQAACQDHLTFTLLLGSQTSPPIYTAGALSVNSSTQPLQVSSDLPPLFLSVCLCLSFSFIFQLKKKNA